MATYLFRFSPDPRTSEVHFPGIKPATISMHTRAADATTDVRGSASDLPTARILVLAYVLCWVSPDNDKKEKVSIYSCVFYLQLLLKTTY